MERLPWGSLDLSRASPAAVLAARSTWTEAAFQEHRTGAASKQAALTMDAKTSFEVARRSLRSVVLEPLLAHGLDPRPWMKRSIDA